MTILLLILGLAILTVGAEVLVRGASALAVAAKISPLVVGLTVVAFGTSAPELAVSVQASFNGQTDIAVGNVVGSNIFNVLFILGISALISPLVVNSQLIRIDVPLMIAASVLMLVLSLDGNIGQLEGIGLFLGIVSYTVWTILKSPQESGEIKQEFAEEYGPEQTPKPTESAFRKYGLQALFIIGGLALTWSQARSVNARSAVAA